MSLLFFYERSLAMKNDTQLWRMRWFLLIVISLCLLASIGVAIVALVLTKSLFMLVIPTPLIVLMRPAVQFLFPSERPRSRQAKSAKKRSIPP
jgi:uncharacterized membrane protein YoaK (UPF0700 family)